MGDINFQQEGDQEMVCKDCGDKYLFTVRDQEFFKERGYTPPKRCKPCRVKKKQAINKVAEGRGRDEA